ncbi:glycine/D-amino acid oxidase-like deaminating enzyme [Azospirillum fermentarium]|uniref:FAD-dependent oxidoreductase n=1 Tax=Azospirillum fermentarium TaxID=1233114 RepID=UPI002227B1F0|nr:FAD-dependent oxidoreductase [Azospirillum fermentarium]MCW2248135.1 glycine/D-amino acid oxidase-like deaminating enzyme [Azospirillum fermentarium]
MTLRPETVGAVIVGGGILGLSAAWHLTRSHTGMSHAGMRVLVLERNGLTTAATAQAAARSGKTSG